MLKSLFIRDRLLHFECTGAVARVDDTPLSVRPLQLTAVGGDTVVQSQSVPLHPPPRPAPLPPPQPRQVKLQRRPPSPGLHLRGTPSLDVQITFLVLAVKFLFRNVLLLIVGYSWVVGRAASFGRNVRGLRGGVHLNIVEWGVALASLALPVPAEQRATVGWRRLSVAHRRLAALASQTIQSGHEYPQTVPPTNRLPRRQRRAV